MPPSVPLASPPRLRGLVAAALAASLALAACGPSVTSQPTLVPGPSPLATTVLGTAAPSVDPEAVYARIASQVEQIRGLQPKTAVTPVLLDAAQLRANLTKDFNAENPPAEIQAAQDELVELGLLPAGTSLAQAELDLQAGQVAGYYSPEAKQLFVVSRSGGIGPTQRSTYAHEFTHQLQDQNFDLAKLGLDSTDQSDRSLARLALVEGDAVATQDAWMTANLTAADIAQILADAADPAAVAALSHAPPFLRQVLLFPYTAGLTFVGALQASGGEAAVNQAFGHPPASTEQILHPAAYLAGEAPSVVSLPKTLASSLGPGWRVLTLDTLGEYEIQAWLGVDGVASATAQDAAAGWAGDRLAVLAGPSGSLALGLVTRWDTAADATAFDAALGVALGQAPGTSRHDVRQDGLSVAVVVAPSPALAAALLAPLDPVHA